MLPDGAGYHEGTQEKSKTWQPVLQEWGELTTLRKLLSHLPSHGTTWPGWPHKLSSVWDTVKSKSRCY